MTPDRDASALVTPLAAEGVPSPRAEILARVLEGLRGLPDERRVATLADVADLEALSADAAAAGVPAALLPLPRRS